MKVSANQEDVTAAHELIVQVVRGEMPLQALQSLGIEIGFDDGEFFLSTQVDDPRKLTWDVEVTHVDLAHGLLQFACDPAALQRWGRFIMASDVDFDDSLPNHALVMDAVWDAAFANPLSTDTLVQLRRVASADN